MTEWGAAQVRRRVFMASETGSGGRSERWEGGAHGVGEGDDAPLSIDLVPVATLPVGYNLCARPFSSQPPTRPVRLTKTTLERPRETTKTL